MQGYSEGGDLELNLNSVTFPQIIIPGSFYQALNSYQVSAYVDSWKFNGAVPGH